MLKSSQNSGQVITIAHKKNLSLKLVRTRRSQTSIWAISTVYWWGRRMWPHTFVLVLVQSFKPRHRRMKRSYFITLVPKSFWNNTNIHHWGFIIWPLERNINLQYSIQSTGSRVLACYPSSARLKLQQWSNFWWIQPFQHSTYKVILWMYNLLIWFTTITRYSKSTNFGGYKIWRFSK